MRIGYAGVSSAGQKLDVQRLQQDGNCRALRYQQVIGLSTVCREPPKNRLKNSEKSEKPPVTKSGAIVSEKE